MKRQVEEAEEEIDRLENSKKKLQRDLEDQVDLNSQLQGQLATIRQDLRWERGPSRPWAASRAAGFPWTPPPSFAVFV